MNHHAPDNTVRNRGFTLLELLVVLVCCGILTAIGIPSYRSLSATLSVSSAAADIAWALQLARAEAIRRQRRVAVCETAQDGVCPLSPISSNGWTVTVDTNGDRLWNNGDAILQRYGPNAAGLIIGSSRRGPIIFASDGRSAGSTTTITVCHPASRRQRQIIVNNAGRVRTSAKTLAADETCQ